MSVLRLVEALERALTAQRRGTSAAIIHVVTNRSDLPLDMGLKMVVMADGTSAGTFHPWIDRAAHEAAQETLAERRSRLFSLIPDADGGSIMGMQGGQLELFVELLAAPPSLIIVGAGHIAQPLAQLGKLLDFTVTVLDDRPDFANRERFPDADIVKAQPFAEALAETPITADTYIVLVTRGHVHDAACLERVLPSPAPYIGMIGSQRRVRTVMKNLRAKGFSSAELERVYAPIGIDIGAETPAEIALSIAAEIVNLRRGGRAPHLALKERLRV
jgi:xanthine dehydrogenase accessory factor